MTERSWAIILHGGARSIPEDRHDRNRAGCLAAVMSAADLLRSGGTALQAVEHAVRLLEDDTTYNAGSGSVPNSDGDLELDAAVMDGSTLDVGAVAAIRDVRNPVAVARMLLREPTVLLAGDGAQAFATANGVTLETVAPAPDAGSGSGHDTVGCVAVDAAGRFAVATSTGGVPGQVPGRIGDAPVPGCGFYADDAVGGVAISGDGESILRSVLSFRVVEAMRDGAANAAASKALEALARVGGEAGIVAIGADGRFGIAHNSDHFSVGLASSRLDAPRAGIHRSEFEDIIDA
jgi:L-asparaginase / beta-aspartyl-peptidase